jgi:hypothetical protein
METSDARAIDGVLRTYPVTVHLHEGRSGIQVVDCALSTSPITFQSRPTSWKI